MERTLEPVWQADGIIECVEGFEPELQPVVLAIGKVLQHSNTPDAPS
jgi:hypothetical protein